MENEWVGGEPTEWMMDDECVNDGPRVCERWTTSGGGGAWWW